MQELIDELESINGYPMMPLILRIMKNRLEKEKEQICNAYVEGLEGLWISAEEYYNKEFNQNRELPKEDKTFKRKSKWT